MAALVHAAAIQQTTSTACTVGCKIVDYGYVPASLSIASVAYCGSYRWPMASGDTQQRNSP